jgi:hypothetical protein
MVCALQQITLYVSSTTNNSLSNTPGPAHQLTQQLSTTHATVKTTTLTTITTATTATTNDGNLQKATTGNGDDDDEQPTDEKRVEKRVGARDASASRAPGTFFFFLF